MNNIVYSWLQKYSVYNKKLILVIDTCIEPNPLLKLFEEGIVSLRGFTCLYKDTELANNLEISPWIIEFNDDFSITCIEYFLENPEINWGWLASMDSSFTLEQLVKHWQERIIVQEGASKLVYRFQDNRTISWHLQNLSEVDIPLLLGPISSVLTWSGSQWEVYCNPQPNIYSDINRAPWLAIDEPEQVASAIRNQNMTNWLFNNYPKTLYEFSEIDNFHTWVNEQLLKAKEWGWHDRKQWEFLIGQQLDPKQRQSEAWKPLDNETSADHYERCKTIFNKPLAYIETYLDTEKI